MWQIKEEEIIELIQKGYSLELMSFEFKIPIDYLNSIKKQMELSKINSQENKNINTREEKNIYFKIEEMRRKYKLLINNNATANNKSNKVNQTEYVTKVINGALNSVEENINSIAEALCMEDKIKIFKKISKDIEIMSKYSLTLEQSYNIYKLFKREEIEKINSNKEFNGYIQRNRNIINLKLSDAIVEEADNTEDIEKLRKLQKLIQTDKSTTFNFVKIKIDNKITKLRQNDVMNKIKNDISPSIKELAMQIVSGNLDIEMAENIIDTEAENMLNNGPKTKFSLTKEQYKKQILLQINLCVEQKAVDYPVENWDNTIEILQKLGEDKNKAIITVTRNFISRKNYLVAEQICEKYYKSIEPQLVRILENEIKNAKIKDAALKMLEDDCMPMEAIENYNLILKSKANLSSIVIGTNGDKKVTLGDIWNYKIEKSR